MASENEQFDQELAELRAEFGPENVSIMDGGGIPKLTLITEDEEYNPDEGGTWKE